MSSRSTIRWARCDRVGRRGSVCSENDICTTSTCEEKFAVSSGFKLDINGFYVYLCYIRPHTTSVHVDCARTLSHACAEFIARCRRTLFVPSGETVSHCTCSPHFTAPNKKSRLTATLDFGAIWLPSPRVLVVAAIHLHRLDVRRASSCAGDMWRAAHGNSCNCTHDEGSGSICVPDEDLLIRERADNS